MRAPLASLASLAWKPLRLEDLRPPRSLQPGRFQRADEGQVKVIDSWKTMMIAQGLDPETRDPHHHPTRALPCRADVCTIVFPDKVGFPGGVVGSGEARQTESKRPSREKSFFHSGRATVPQCLSPPGAAHKRAFVRTACSLAHPRLTPVHLLSRCCLVM